MYIDTYFIQNWVILRYKESQGFYVKMLKMYVEEIKLYKITKKMTQLKVNQTF